mgnify:CR=1 FL=1
MLWKQYYGIDTTGRLCPTQMSHLGAKFHLIQGCLIDISMRPVQARILKATLIMRAVMDPIFLLVVLRESMP